MWMVRIAPAAFCFWVWAGSAEAALEATPNEPVAASMKLADGIAAMKRGDDFIAFEILSRFAEQGDRAALFNLGMLYLHGRGTPSDPHTARRLFEAAAEQGLALAIDQLASLSKREGDSTKALFWYRRGAAQGDPHCLFGLALMYQAGDGVTASATEAAKFYRMAALGGHGKAQLILGVMSYQGIGVRKDLVEAHRWFALAQSTLPPGIDRERSIRAISLIRTGLTTEQLSIVQATAPVASTGE